MAIGVATGKGVSGVKVMSTIEERTKVPMSSAKNGLLIINFILESLDQKSITNVPI